MSTGGRALAIACLALGLAIAGACNRERARRERIPAGSTPPGTVQQIPLVPGMPGAARTVESPYQGDPQARNEGKRLYNWMNCSGCHFEGGGGIGPALMDADWIYGREPAQIFDSIASGRANGMPAYGDKLASDQIWLIVEHVRSLSETVGQSQDAAEKGVKSGGGS